MSSQESSKCGYHERERGHRDSSGSRDTESRYLKKNEHHHERDHAHYHHGDQYHHKKHKHKHKKHKSHSKTSSHEYSPPTQNIAPVRASSSKFPAPDEDEDDGDFDFDFTRYKSDFAKIFFRENNYMKRGSHKYDDFWSFVEKYQHFQRKRKDKPKTASFQQDASSSSGGKLGLPKRYDNRYRINMSFVSRDAENFLMKGRLPDADIDKDITKRRAKQFQNILLHYLDFEQKEKINKLRKIKDGQRNLPIYQYKEAILRKVKENKVIVVAGDTGCGKSTQVPQYLLEGGFEKVACTQPRRIACVSLSKRVGFESLNEYGSSVGYMIRFEKQKTRATRILFLTEGLLLRQMSTDPYLSQYNVILLDEVHERHIHTDFLLGVLKCLLRHRKDLNLVLMSATINVHLFSDYFDNCPIIQVPGRLYPIQLHYCPVLKDESSSRNRFDPSPYLKIMQTIDQKYSVTERGDLLVFLSGLSDITNLSEAVKVYAQNTKKWIVLHLHSLLSIEEQDKVFGIAPDGVRKCILSTNIAETSVTIDGVRFIIDSGKMKEMSHDSKYKMQRLQEFWISQASAEQRKGRAGRTGPGVCYRLYDESDYSSLQEYPTPNIQRVSLDSLVLQMISMGLPNARKFPFLEPPPQSNIETSISFLKEQGALTDSEDLTSIGEMLDRLPVDVVIGKMLIMGSLFHMIDPAITIAAAMSVQSPFELKAGSNHACMTLRKRLESDQGDPFTLLNAFDAWIQVKAEGRGTKKWCNRHGLGEQKLYIMMKMKKQFSELLEENNLVAEPEESNVPTTSEERRRRHGDRKRLRELKKRSNKESRKRKILKMDDEDYVISDEDDNDDNDKEEDDIKDLEFRLSHDLNKLQEKSNRSRDFTLHDINLLKIILCSGLYPQVAIADESNSYKGNSELMFHTKNKPFVVLNPTSVFTVNPELLKPADTSLYENEGPSDLRGKLSNKHILLTFTSLLETNKPYMVNVMKVPALQILTLFSQSVDTNAECTRLVCDGWLEIRFKAAEDGEQVIASVIQLRSTWQSLIKSRLEDTLKTDDTEKRVSLESGRLERLLARKLSEYIDCDVLYAVRRILTSEKQYMYVGARPEVLREREVKDFLKVSEDRKPHPTKGGVQVNEYLVYNCLLDDVSASVWGEYTPHMQKHWTCPRCDTSMIVNVVDRLQHEAECQGQNSGAEADVNTECEDSNPLKKAYTCKECDKDFKFTATEILRHKKLHV